MNSRFVETFVGFFMLLGVLALLVLALQVSGLSTELTGQNGYKVTAAFDNIGDLKVRAPVTIGGVRVGQVSSISLDPISFKANVTILLDSNQNKIPSDSSASIYTAGLLGANYISLTPGFDNDFLHNGSVISQTHPAIVLENLIGQLMFKLGGGDNKKADTTEASKQ
ncbi:MAG: mlaD [Gammaproteobacteria bacterium]|jgi:phospholipid/cholesterol/gamma-HCH transport system substrate-binding protein|nr:mlaD [Gammaproteobacteria bacterium]